MIRPLFVAFLLVVPLPVAAQAPALEAAADRAAWAQFEKQNLVGLAVGVVEEGKVAYLKGFGYADREACTPVDPGKTLFRWASCSKPLTAIAALQLAETGKLDLDADVRDYVPEFPDKGTPITARQLLCHQGGIVHYINGKVIRTKREYDAEHPFEDVVLALDTFKESPLVGKPGREVLVHHPRLHPAQRRGPEGGEAEVRRPGPRPDRPAARHDHPPAGLPVEGDPPPGRRLPPQGEGRGRSLRSTPT